MIDLRSCDPDAARALLDDMRRVAEARNEAALWELWAKAAFNLTSDLVSRDPVAARALLDDIRSVAGCDPVAARALLNDMRGVAAARDEAPLWEQWAEAAVDLIIDLGSRDSDAARAMLDEMRGIAEARDEAPLWELWVMASSNLIVNLESREPAASRTLIDGMLRAVETHPGEVGGWQTKVVGIVLMTAFTLTKNLGLSDQAAARAFCADVLGLPDWLLQKMHFGG